MFVTKAVLFVVPVILWLPLMHYCYGFPLYNICFVFIKCSILPSDTLENRKKVRPSERGYLHISAHSITSSSLNGLTTNKCINHCTLLVVHVKYQWEKQYFMKRKCITLWKNISEIPLKVISKQHKYVSASVKSQSLVGRQDVTHGGWCWEHVHICRWNFFFIDDTSSTSLQCSGRIVIFLPQKEWLAEPENKVWFLTNIDVCFWELVRSSLISSSFYSFVCPPRFG